MRIWLLIILLSLPMVQAADFDERIKKTKVFIKFLRSVIIVNLHVVQYRMIVYSFLPRNINTKCRELTVDFIIFWIIFFELFGGFTINEVY